MEEVHNELQEKLEIMGEFCIQYEDPEFGHAACNQIYIAVTFIKGCLACCVEQ